MSSVGSGAGGSGVRGFRRRLHGAYLLYTLALAGFIGAMAAAERFGLGRNLIGLTMLLGTVVLYAAIGLRCRTSDAAEYYVAGRRVPAFYNGMATSADWMSAASFIGLAGTLYLSGYNGLAFVIGWTGGFCLVALLIAPYLRKFGEYTIPDFLGARYGGTLPRLVGIVAAVVVSFVYVVAQIYGVGLIVARFTGFGFEIGIFVGLGGVLVCSFLGGMRAVTWTQVAQCIILVVAYLAPVAWLSLKVSGNPVPQVAMGQVLQAVSEREAQLVADPGEREVMAAYAQRAAVAGAKLLDVPAAMAEDRAAAQRRVERLTEAAAPLAEVQAARRTLAALPRTEDEARRLYGEEQASAEAWSQPLGGMPPHAQAFAANPRGAPASRPGEEHSRRNFLALVFCLMLGTAGLPHILTRFYTTPSVREARRSVGWTLLFICALYLTAPALALLVKHEVFNGLVGTPFDSLPSWIASWSKVDPSLVQVSDVNGDGILQLGELHIGADLVTLAAPEIAGLPYVISAMVAVGGLAAALSTADGLLLTISNALSHDLYYRVIDPKRPSSRRVAVSKVLLLVVALAAAYVASMRIADILFLVAAAFSLAASSFFPALVLGVFWKRANRWGCVGGMLTGLVVTSYYMATTQPWLRGLFGVTQPLEDCLWLGIAPIAAGVFGVPAAFVVMLLLSLATPRPDGASERLVDRIRDPRPGG
ncbi:sodium:solute symporter family protein [Rubrivivax gelatinosus]|uniref:Cation acetate symporter n=1 Tax=Rubrivivax gelatinosus TaxID=28068 RepID=A0ABS1DUC8_RUBGE|nr:sodium:solute symporter family protein [Rubrivivax gelatinosus]MBK1712575.1 cation acetate symporter [Rubrivivax gelatinosus]